MMDLAEEHVDKTTNGHSPQFRPSSLHLHLDALNSSTETKRRAAATVQEIVDMNDVEEGVSGSHCCAVVVLPLFITAFLVGALLAIISTSGGSMETAGVPRAVLFVIEGLKGTTFDELLENQRLPHIRRMLVEQRGVYAACTTSEDARCARVVPVEDGRTGEPFVSAAAGMASIITGVSPEQHRVRNDSTPSYHVFSSTSLEFPSIALRVTRAGKRVTAVGGPSLLNGLNTTTGLCNIPGILDEECDNNNNNNMSPLSSTFMTPGGDRLDTAKIDSTPMTAALSWDTAHAMSCLHQKSCNLFRRVLTLSSRRDGMDEKQFTKLLLDLFEGLSTEGREVGKSFDDTLLIFNFNALSLHAGDASLPEFTYNEDSLEYAAQAFLIDSLIGQVLALVQNRAQTKNENWLVVGTSNHGDVGKSYGHFGKDAEVIPFFVSTYTSNNRGYTRLRSLTRPVTYMDAAPTILQWLDIEPYNNNNNNNDNTGSKKDDAGNAIQMTAYRKRKEGDKVYAAPLKERRLDGVPQGICGSGLKPVDCAV